jgi:hypothetical protein
LLRLLTQGCNFELPGTRRSAEEVGLVDQDAVVTCERQQILGLTIARCRDAGPVFTKFFCSRKKGPGLIVQGPL